MIADIDRNGMMDLASKLEITHARNAALADALEDLVLYVQRVGGYLSPADQQTMRKARALLAGQDGGER